MTKHKKKGKGSIMGDFTPAFGMAGASMGLGVVGGAIQPHLPAGMKNPMTEMGSSMVKFVPVTTALGGVSTTTKQLKKLIKSMKGIN